MLNYNKLVCLGTYREFADNGLLLENPESPNLALMRAIYPQEKFRIRETQPGIFRYSDWLPVSRIIKSDGAPVTYLSTKLGRALGLNRLYVTFNGFWPEIGANMMTGTFKECEAYSVCARMPINSGTLVVASAGNTARAFMKVASENHIQAVIVVPEANLDSLWSLEDLHPCVKIIAVGDGADYLDAIRMAGAIARLDGFVNEGGAKNVGRRDGMGTTVLSAAAAIGEIPDYYFQAVGSGTGAIAAHEANLRLNACGVFAPKKMRLIVSQNLPFVPIARAWAKKSRALDPLDEQEARQQIDAIDAKVLSNRQPPYGIIGGLYDALMDSGGDVVAVENSEAREAQDLFLTLEGRDICPEAGVALASLIRKAKEGSIEKNAAVMLNVTGGGMDALARERRLIRANPHLLLKKDEDISQVKQKIMSL
ncbi:MAG: cysteate synthase [Clostridiales bacterium]|nr:cysteate synthase [Clostridiales bacterium]